MSVVRSEASAPADGGERLTRPTHVRALLERLGVRPSRVMGQNFLIDRNILDILLDTAALAEGAHVLEIGPGLGVVTERLLERAGRVTAIEKDERLCDYLEERFSGNERFRLVRGDAVRVDLAPGLNRGAASVVSNLPYSVGSRVLVGLAKNPCRPVRMVVTVQEEVARRLTAAPGESDYGLLTVLLRLRYRARMVRSVPPTCFWPAPEIRSAIVVLDRREECRVTEAEEDAFTRLAREAFAQRRKQMGGVARRVGGAHGIGPGDVTAWLCAAGIEPERRPETLDVEEWLRLARGGRDGKSEPENGGRTCGEPCGARDSSVNPA